MNGFIIDGHVYLRDRGSYCTNECDLKKFCDGVEKRQDDYHVRNLCELMGRWNSGDTYRYSREATLKLHGGREPLCSASSDVTILVATDEEYRLAKKYLSKYTIVQTGVGASNIIRTMCKLGESRPVINIGFCGANGFHVGSVFGIGETCRFKNKNVEFKDYRNGFKIGNTGITCYTSNSFVTKDDVGGETDYHLALFDMELNYIAAFPNKLLGAIKIVSDNLDVEEYTNTVAKSEDKIWKEVRALVEEILAKKG